MRQGKGRNIFILILLTGDEGTGKENNLREPGPEPSFEDLKPAAHAQSCPSTLASLCLLLFWTILFLES